MCFRGGSISHVVPLSGKRALVVVCDLIQCEGPRSLVGFAKNGSTRLHARPAVRQSAQLEVGDVTFYDSTRCSYKQ
jgi:hypothetical protein